MSHTNKRLSVMPKVGLSGPKPPVKFSSSITIADSALLTGSHSILISSESVIHPRAKLDSMSGRIIIGRRCIVDERTSIGAAPTEPVEDDSRDGVVLGDYVTVEVGATIESGETTIGEGSVLGVGSTVGKGAVLGKHCTLTPKSVVRPGEVVPDFTTIYSNGVRRLDKRGVTELKNKAQARQIEVLKRLIPSNPAKFQ